MPTLCEAQIQRGSKAGLQVAFAARDEVGRRPILPGSPFRTRGWKAPFGERAGERGSPLLLGRGGAGRGGGRLLRRGAPAEPPAAAAAKKLCSRSSRAGPGTSPAVPAAAAAMANFTGSWKMRSSENFEELLKALGERRGCAWGVGLKGSGDHAEKEGDGEATPAPATSSGSEPGKGGDRRLLRAGWGLREGPQDRDPSEKAPITPGDGDPRTASPASFAPSGPQRLEPEKQRGWREPSPCSRLSLSRFLPGRDRGGGTTPQVGLQDRVCLSFPLLFPGLERRNSALFSAAVLGDLPRWGGRSGRGGSGPPGATIQPQTGALPGPSLTQTVLRGP